MGFVKCALPPRHIARTVSTDPFVRLISNKSGRKLMLSQAKKDRYGTFSVAGSILMIAGYNPGQVTAEYGPGWVLFDAIGLPKAEPSPDPPEKKIEPWKLTTSPKVTIQVVRALVEQKPEEKIAHDLLLKPHELAAIKTLVPPKQLAIVRARSKPGQEQWFIETEEEWTKRQLSISRER